MSVGSGTQPSKGQSPPSSDALDDATKNAIMEKVKEVITKEIEKTGRDPKNMPAAHVSWS